MKYIFLFFLSLFLSTCCVCEDDYILRCEGFSETIEYNEETINRKVIVIGVDGVRSDVVQESISPFLFSLSKSQDTYFTDSHIVEGNTYSGPNWSSILTGVHMNKHNVLDNDFNSPNFDDFPPFFYFLENIQHEVNTVSLVNWLPIQTHITSNFVDYGPEESLSDYEVFNTCKEILINNNPVEGDVIFLQFDELDGAGHNYGFSADVEEYRNTLSVIDDYIEELFYIIQNKRISGEDWLILVVSDHGGDGNGHGDSNNPHINKTVFYANHPSLNFIDYHISSMADLVPTIFSFLGVYSEQYQCKTDGVSLLEFVDQSDN
jgi:predicted AlkP superfamily pyrophosphatase or phosphodiesterase